MARENDIVLIYYEDKPYTFARIEEIRPDSKPDWYHVKLLMLQVPLQIVTWILRDIYINGEKFTMNEKRMRLELVVNPEKKVQTENRRKSAETPSPQDRANVISLNDRQKKQ